MFDLKYDRSWKFRSYDSVRAHLQNTLGTTILILPVTYYYIILSQNEIFLIILYKRFSLGLEQ